MSYVPTDGKTELTPVGGFEAVADAVPDRPAVIQGTGPVPCGATRKRARRLTQLNKEMQNG